MVVPWIVVGNDGAARQKNRLAVLEENMLMEKARGVIGSSRLCAYWDVLSEHTVPSPVFIIEMLCTGKRRRCDTTAIVRIIPETLRAWDYPND